MDRESSLNNYGQRKKTDNKTTTYLLIRYYLQLRKTTRSKNYLRLTPPLFVSSSVFPVLYLHTTLPTQPLPATLHPYSPLPPTPLLPHTTVVQGSRE